MQDIMVDLETMGVKSNAAIIAIGAVAFDLETGELGEEFYEVVKLESAVACGGIMQPSTVLWWMQQSDAARAEFKREGVDLPRALVSFSQYVRRTDITMQGIRIWGNGANFDNVLLRDSFERCSIPAPWMFWNDRCFRTMKAMLPQVVVEREGTAHNALADAVYQAKYLIKAVQASR